MQLVGALERKHACHPHHTVKAAVLSATGDAICNKNALHRIGAGQRDGGWAAGAPSATMRFHPSRTVSPRAVLSTCSSSFMRSTGAVAVRLTAPATPAAHVGSVSALPVPSIPKVNWLLCVPCKATCSGSCMPSHEGCGCPAPPLLQHIQGPSLGFQRL